MTREMLLKKSLDDLREIARTLGAKAVTKYRKAELADIIMAGGRLPSPSESAAAPANDAAVKQDDNLSPAVPEAEPQGAPSAPQTPEVDYAPRKRGRPKKAINDPSPTKPSEKDAPEAEPLPAKQAEDRRYRNYQRNRADRADHRQHRADVHACGMKDRRGAAEIAVDEAGAADLQNVRTVVSGLAERVALRRRNARRHAAEEILRFL